METLKEAPLIEVVFQLMWSSSNDDRRDVETITAEIQPRITATFAQILEKRGFTHQEVRRPADFLPVVNLYRHTEDSWPVIQLGQGFLSVNQINAGYTWESFKANIKAALQDLDSAIDTHEHETTLGMLVLSYRDGFRVGEEEMSTFVESHLDFPMNIPTRLGTRAEGDPEFGVLAVSNHVRSGKPNGTLDLQLSSATVNGVPGLLLKIDFRSSDESLPADAAQLDTWLEEAHDLQTDAFRAVLKPEYLESFKGSLL